jgi:hypothetical protein
MYSESEVKALEECSAPEPPLLLSARQRLAQWRANRRDRMAAVVDRSISRVLSFCHGSYNTLVVKCVEVDYASKLFPWHFSFFFILM